MKMTPNHIVLNAYEARRARNILACILNAIKPSQNVSCERPYKLFIRFVVSCCSQFTVNVT